jgi:hypothetical protein
MNHARRFLVAISDLTGMAHAEFILSEEMGLVNPYGSLDGGARLWYTNLRNFSVPPYLKVGFALSGAFCAA